MVINYNWFVDNCLEIISFEEGNIKQNNELISVKFSPLTPFENTGIPKVFRG